MEKVSIEDIYDSLVQKCVFVISIDDSGKPSGMVAGWNTLCSIEPPLYAVSISRNKYTHNLISKSKEFVIAIPNKELEKELILFGSMHGDEIDKFEESKLETENAEFVKSPLIKNATMNFECKLVKETDVGHHTIFIGEILASHINKGKKSLVTKRDSDGSRLFKEF